MSGTILAVKMEKREFELLGWKTSISRPFMMLITERERGG